jgi:hypothetical protein
MLFGTNGLLSGIVLRHSSKGKTRWYSLASFIGEYHDLPAIAVAFKAAEEPIFLDKWRESFPGTWIRLRKQLKETIECRSQTIA